MGASFSRKFTKYFLKGFLFIICCKLFEAGFDCLVLNEHQHLRWTILVYVLVGGPAFGYLFYRQDKKKALDEPSHDQSAQAG